MAKTRNLAERGIGVVILLSIVLIVIGYVTVPIALASLQGTSETSVNQSVGEEITVTGSLNATLDSVSTTAPESATITLNDSEVTGSQTITVDNGTNTTTTIDGKDITVSVSNVETGYAEITYEYSTRYNLGSGATAMIGIIGLVGVLAIFLLFIGVGIDEI